MITVTSLFAIVVLIISILVALSAHEAMHAYVGWWLGDTTAEEQGRLSLNPLRHIDLFTTVILPIVTLLLFQTPILAAKPVPFNPARVRYGEFGAALIALAGPLTNLVLAALAAAVFHVLASGWLAGALYIFTSLNVAVGIFNLVPIPPLDGSRVLYAVAPEAVQQFMRQLEPYGMIIVFALVLLSGFGGVLVNLDQAVLQLLLG